jgi:tetratricopeptide (TPR) repeat protein
MVKKVLLHNTLKFAIIFFIGFSVCAHVRTSLAENIEKPAADNSLKSDLHLNISELMEYRAEEGLANLEPHAIVLTNEGLKAYNEKREKEAVSFFETASELSPDLPTPYLHLAKINSSLSLNGIYTLAVYLLDAWEAFCNNFQWSFHTAGVLSLSLLLALYASIIIFLLALMSSKARIYIHDIGEDRKKILLLLPSIILVFLGPIFGIAGLLLPFWIYMKAREKVFIYCMFLVSACIILISPAISPFLSANSDKTLRDVIKINEGIYTGEIPDINRKGRSYEASFSYALHLKKKGRYNKTNYEEAIKIYKDILSQKQDARVYNNLANCFVALGSLDKDTGAAYYNEAVTYYNEALKLEKLASAYYNLSQIYREGFDFGDADKYYQDAVKIDQQKVAFYNSVKGISVNRFVMDEHLSNKDLWPLAFKWRSFYKPAEFLESSFSFLNMEFSIILLLLIAGVLYVYGRYASRGAYKCRRCGEIYCSKCEKRISHDDACLMCFRTLVRISELGTKERIERILEIQQYRYKNNQRLKILTFVFPGSGHVYYGRPGIGLLILLAVTFFFFSTLLWFYIPAPESMNQITGCFRWISASGLILSYIAALTNVFRRTQKKWL